MPLKDYPHKCNKCRRPAFDSGFSIKCSNVLCENAEHPLSEEAKATSKWIGEQFKRALEKNLVGGSKPTRSALASTRRFTIGDIDQDLPARTGRAPIVIKAPNATGRASITTKDGVIAYRSADFDAVQIPPGRSVWRLIPSTKS